MGDNSESMKLSSLQMVIQLDKESTFKLAFNIEVTKDDKSKSKSKS